MKLPPNLSFILRIHENSSTPKKSKSVLVFQNQFVLQSHYYIVQKGELCLSRDIKIPVGQRCQCVVPHSDKTKAFTEDLSLTAPAATEGSHSFFHQFIHVFIQQYLLGSSEMLRTKGGAGRIPAPRELSHGRNRDQALSDSVSRVPTGNNTETLGAGRWEVGKLSFPPTS